MKDTFFSKNIIALRKQRNLTTAFVAEEINVSEETLVAWELGMQEPEIKHIIEIAKLYNVDSSDLVNTPIYEANEEPKKEKKKEAKNKVVKEEPQKQEINTDKNSKKYIVFQSIVMILSVLSVIMFALPCFSINMFGNRIDILFFDILLPSEFSLYTLFSWIILLVVLYNIVNVIMLLASKSLRNGKYGYVSQVLMLSLNAFALVLWIMICIVNRDCEFRFAAIWLLIVFTIIILLLLLANKPALPKNSKKFLILQTIVMLLSAITVILLTTDCFAIDIVAFTYIDILITNFSFTTVFSWIILLILLYNIVNSIILLASSSARNGKYKNISQVLMLSLNAFALVLWIAASILNKDCEFRFAAIWLFILFAINIVLLILANVKSKKTKQNSTQNKKIAFYCLAVASLLAIVITICFLLVFDITVDGNSGLITQPYRSTFFMLLFITFVLICLIMLILLVKKYRKNKKGRKGLEITSIVLSALMCPIALILYFCACIEVYGGGEPIQTNSDLLLLSTIIIAAGTMLAASIIALTVKNKKELSENKSVEVEKSEEEIA